MYVFVLDTNKKSLAPCLPVKARKLLDRKKAAVFRWFPFTIILKEAKQDIIVPNLRVKIDPGSKFTGLALLNGNKVIWGAEIQHHGESIKLHLKKRLGQRRSRRSRKLRYRQARFLYRTGRPKGWLPPSLMSRVYNVLTWVNRLKRLCPVSDVSLELNRFDTQLMQNSEISGVQYQQGELQGYEVREYLLEKFDRKCAYCGAKNVPLQIEHVVPKALGGSNRVSNLTLACDECNRAKGVLPIEEFLKNKSKTLKKIKSQLKASLKDAAVVNASRWRLFEGLQDSGLRLEVGTGSRTKYNRSRLGIKKSHWLDAACVGVSTPDDLRICVGSILLIKAKGHGNRQVCSTDKHGFPKSHKEPGRTIQGLATGDIVVANVNSKKTLKTTGKYVSRVSGLSRTNPSTFCLSRGKNWWVNRSFLIKVQSTDGYDYLNVRDIETK